MTLDDIIKSAQGGKAVDTIATRFGLSPEQAQQAIQAVLPAFTMAMQSRLQSGGLGSILQHLGMGGHQNSYTDQSSIQSGAAEQQGGTILNDVLGGDMAAKIAREASARTGVPAQIIQSMLPILASILIGGLSRAAGSGALGGALSSIIGSLLGGKGGGGLGGVLGGLFGDKPQATAQRGTQEPEADGPTEDETAAQPTRSASQAGSPDEALDELSRAFQAGTPAAPEHEEKLARIMSQPTRS